MRFEKKMIDDIAVVKGGKRLPKGENLTSEKTPFPYIRLVDIVDNRVSASNLQYLKESTYKSISRYIVEKDDICLAVVGHTIGLVFYIDENMHMANLTENAVRISVNNNVNPKYIYYFLNSPDGQSQIISKKVGSAQGKLPLYGVKSIEIPLPDIRIQNRIVTILNNLDAKILLNRNMINNFELISQTIFKRWFIDFEFPNEEGQPYKSSGGKMVDSELGAIPEGWSIGTLKDIATIIMGQSPKGDTYNTDGIGVPLINGASDFKGGDIQPNKYTTDPKKLSETGDYIFGVRATLGNVTETDIPYAIGRGAGIARAIKKEYKEFLYAYLINAFYNFEHTASGSVYLNISKTDLNDYKIILPPFKILELYHGLTNSNLEMKSICIQQNKKLNSLRDTLLPKLLSGEIEIPEESVVGEFV